MSPWSPTVFTVGIDPVGTFPALELRNANSPTTIKFDLTKEQIADHTLRIGITCANHARPGIRVNDWTPTRVMEGSKQPDSRSYTIGTYRGNNAVFTYQIPARAFVPGANTLTITPISGTKDRNPWLSAGWVFDAIQLDATPSVADRKGAR
jgi:rhamnogalacturonan endolyase